MSGPDLARLVVKLVRELSQARRELELALILLDHATADIGALTANRARQAAFDQAMLQIAQDYERRALDRMVA